MSTQSQSKAELIELIRDLQREVDSLKSLSASSSVNSDASSDLQWEETFDALDNAIWLLDANQKVVRCNQATLEMFDRMPNEVLGCHCWGLAHGTATAHPDCPMIRMKKSLHRETSEIAIGARFFEVTVDPLFDSNKKLKGAVHIVNDITDRKNTEIKLKENEERFHAIFDSVNDAIFLQDFATGSIVDVNRKATDLYGYAREELLELTIDTISSNVKPYTMNEALEWIRKAATGGTQIFEWEARHKRGNHFWVEINMRKAVIGEKDYLLVSIHDISERHKNEKARRESEQTLWGTVNAVAEKLYLINTNGVVLAANEACAVFLSRTINEIVGKNIFNLLPGPLAKARKGQVEEVIRTGKPAFIEDDWYGRWEEISIYPVFEKECVSRLAIYGRDVTERKLAEKALIESERMMSTLITNLPGFVYRCHNDRKWTMEFISEGCLAVTGYPSTELVRNSKLSYNDLILADDRENVWSLVQNGVLMNKPYQMVYRIRTAHGDIRWVWEKGKGLLDEEGTLVTLEGFVTDISDRIKAEREIEAKNKELEQIIYVTSHDLRSPLVNVQGYSKELGYSVKEINEKISAPGVPADIAAVLKPILAKDIPESLGYIENSIAKMDTLLQGLLKLSRSGRIPLKPERLDMNELIGKVVSDFEFRIKTSKVSVHIAELPECKSDGVMVNQVFSNLIDNALKYMIPERTGKLVITGYSENQRAYYCIEDNGMGIAKEHLDKIFEIFYRLSPKNTTGEGLGLSIVQKIIGRLNGEIKVESEPGTGSKFFVTLPGFKS